LENNIQTGQNISGFAALGLPKRITQNLDKATIVVPKPIQAQAIPPLLEGRDVLGIAQTGSGKTLAFALPIVAQILSLGKVRPPRSARALILVPTRELAVQIADCFTMLSKNTHLSQALLLGGVSRGGQIKKMAPGVDILIATPGRLMDLVRDNKIDLSHTRTLVLDEADRMLDMGFINDVRRIAKMVHDERQTMLFSATMPKEIASLAASLLRDPLRVETAPHSTTAPEIKERVFAVARERKKHALAGFLRDPALRSVIVFTRTKHGADALLRHLDKNKLSAAVIHGNKSQNARQRALQSFRDGKIQTLVATDIAARGIDIAGISHVINFDVPAEAESYVHRIGRTGRNGATGEALTFYDAPSEQSRLKAIEKITAKKFSFEPLPEFASLPNLSSERANSLEMDNAFKTVQPLKADNANKIERFPKSGNRFLPKNKHRNKQPEHGSDLKIAAEMPGQRSRIRRRPNKARPAPASVATTPVTKARRAA